MSDDECGCRASNHYCGVMEGKCKYAALKASHAELVEALVSVARYEEKEDSCCWCELPLMIPYRGHDGNCDYAKAALKKAEALK